jgi:hypothetical protein
MKRKPFLGARSAEKIIGNKKLVDEFFKFYDRRCTKGDTFFEMDQEILQTEWFQKFKNSVKKPKGVREEEFSKRAENMCKIILRILDTKIQYAAFEKSMEKFLMPNYFCSWYEKPSDHLSVRMLEIQGIPFNENGYC